MTLRLFRLPSTLNDDSNQSPLDYDTETLQTTLYSTRLQVIRARWTMTLSIYRYPLLYMMTGNQSPMDYDTEIKLKTTLYSTR